MGGLGASVRVHRPPAPAGKAAGLHTRDGNEGCSLVCGLRFSGRASVSLRLLSRETNHRARPPKHRRRCRQDHLSRGDDTPQKPRDAGLGAGRASGRQLALIHGRPRPPRAPPAEDGAGLWNWRAGRLRPGTTPRCRHAHSGWKRLLRPPQLARWVGSRGQ